MIKSENQPIIKSNKYKHLTTAAGFLISIFFLWLTIKSSGLKVRNINIQSEQLPLFFLSMCCYCLVNYIHSRRARLLWIDLKRNIDTYTGFLIGRFYNSILPGQIGEGLRAWHLAQKNNIRFLDALSSLAVEKWLDGVLFIFFIIVFFIITPFHNNTLSKGLLFTSVTVFSFSLAFILSILFKRFSRYIWKQIIKVKFIGLISYKLYLHATQHLIALLRDRRLAVFILVATIMFMINVLHSCILLHALKIAFPHYGVYASFLISVTLMIIGMIPSAPSNVGVMHFGLYSALIAARENLGLPVNNTDLEQFAIFTFYFHFSILIPDLLLGSIAVLKDRNWLFQYRDQA